MNIHRIYATISPGFRRGRMQRFLRLLAPVSDTTLLDVGGQRDFWTNSDIEATITILNLPAAISSRIPATGLSIAHVIGDGCALPFHDGSFSIVFSNSVIEHVGSWERQRAFAEEARRVGRRLWIQTPAREFFIEPHLIAPFIHWMPRSLQRALIRHFTVWGWLTRPSPAEVEAFLKEVRLIGYAEMRQLFPDCSILRERFLGMTKSYIAVRR